MLSRRTVLPLSIRTARFGLNIPYTDRPLLRLRASPKWLRSHPEWKQKDPFKTVLARDYAAMGKFTEADWLRSSP